MFIGGFPSQLFDGAADAIFVRDIESGFFLDVNDVACERLGYSKEELLQMNPAEVVSPEYTFQIPNGISEVRKRASRPFESAHIRKDGKVFPVEINQKGIQYGGKQAILSIARDISQGRFKLPKAAVEQLAQHLAPKNGAQKKSIATKTPAETPPSKKVDSDTATLSKLFPDAKAGMYR